MTTVSAASPDPEYQSLVAEAMKTCAEERIHQLGTIQPVGILLAVDESDLRIRMASDNLAELFHVSPENALGKPLATLIGVTQAKVFGDLSRQENWPGSVICSIVLESDGRATALDAREQFTKCAALDAGRR